jgi:hypothetical protein
VWGKGVAPQITPQSADLSAPVRHRVRRFESLTSTQTVAAPCAQKKGNALLQDAALFTQRPGRCDAEKPIVGDPLPQCAPAHIPLLARTLVSSAAGLRTVVAQNGASRLRRALLETFSAA